MLEEKLTKAFKLAGFVVIAMLFGIVLIDFLVGAWNFNHSWAYW